MHGVFSTLAHQNAGQRKRRCSKTNQKLGLLVVFGSATLADNGLLSEIKLFTMKQVMVQ